MAILRSIRHVIAWVMVACKWKPTAQPPAVVIGVVDAHAEARFHVPEAFGVLRSDGAR